MAESTVFEWLSATGEFLKYTDSRTIAGPYLPLGLAARGSGPAWMAFECFRYHAKLRRQRALGLVPRLVVDRVLAWGVGIGASALAYAFTVGHRVHYGTGLREHDWALGMVSLLALISSLCIAFAFFPPKPIAAGHRDGWTMPWLCVHVARPSS